MFFSKLRRVWIVEEFVPNVSVCARTVVMAESIAVSADVIVEVFWKPPAAIVEWPRPVLLNVTPSALLWQIYSSCMFAHIHLWQCGHRFGGIRAMRATMA